MRMDTLETKKRGKKQTRAQSASAKSSRAKGSARKSAPMRTAARRAPARATAAESKTTTSLDEIRGWAEQRGGAPATVKRTAKGGEAGVLRIDFPGFSGAGTLEHISWEEWFDKFQEAKLAFLYQDKTKDGKESRFFKLIKRK